jgi:predicted Zn-ribbon and HTH transcriptional regulator
VVSKSADLGSFDPAALPTTREAEVDTGEATSEASSEAAIRCTLRCKHCGQEFVPKAAMRPVGYRRGGQQVYCSPGCRAKAANEGRKEKRIAAKAALRKAAREAAREVTRETATCKHCGQEFVRVRRRGRLQVYCSPGCTKTGQASEAKKKARKAGL